MQNIAFSLVESGTKCWACPVFDYLFAIISGTASAAYQRLCIFSIIIFCILFSFFILKVVWENIVQGEPDTFMQKSVKPVIIKSLVALALLSTGLLFPRFISTITFEPVAKITLQYSRTMLPRDFVVSEDYQAIKLSDDGFFNPKLRDTMLKLIETSVASFQTYIEIGIAIMDQAFTLKALIGIGALIRHIIVFFIGLFLTYNFVRLFVKYSFCFMDVIISMAIFAFFFPISIVFFIFKDAKPLPEWIKKIGGNLGAGQIKKIINAITSIAATILTYTIIMLIIRGFLDANGVDPDSVKNTTGSIFGFDLENSSAMEMTFAGAIVLVYVIRYIADKVPDITKKIMSTLGLSQEDSLSKEMGDNMLALTSIIANQAKNLTKAIINPESVKKDKGEEKEEK